MGENDGYYNADARGPPQQQYGQYQQQQPNYGYNNQQQQSNYGYSNQPGYNQGYNQGQYQQQPPPPQQSFQQDHQQGYQQPTYGAPPPYSYNPPQPNDEKYSFEQAFKIEKPKYNDLWAGILVSGARYYYGCVTFN
jgi:hypothetical protein